MDPQLKLKTLSPSPEQVSSNEIRKFFQISPTTDKTSLGDQFQGESKKKITSKNLISHRNSKSLVDDQSQLNLKMKQEYFPSIQLTKKGTLTLSHPRINSISTSLNSQNNQTQITSEQRPIYYKLQSEKSEIEDKNDFLDMKKEKQLLRNLENSFEILYYDKNPGDIVGIQASKQYFNHYKKLNKIQQQNTLAHLKESIQTSMVNQVEKLDLLPCKLGIIKPLGDETVLQIKNQRYGDSYASVLTEGLRINPIIRDFILQNNRIKEKGASSLINVISKNARSLEIQENNIGKLGIEAICKSLILKESKLEILNLEDNKLGNRNIIKLIKALQIHSTIKVLNISKNFLTNDVCELLKQFITGNDHLEELYLHWNQIKGNGGLILLEGLSETENLKVLDISYNGFGQENPNCSIKLGEYIKQNKSLVHLDASANFFKKEQSKFISDCLKANRTIYGFHFGCNYGYVDARGFLIVDEEMIESSQTQILRINGVKQVTSFGVYSQDPVLLKDVCWICQGWQEREFKWKGESDIDPVFIHLQSENFKSVYLPKVSNQNLSQLKLMTPPHRMKYFYTVVDEQLFDKDQPTETTWNQIYYQIQVYDKKIDIQLECNNISRNSKHAEVLNQKTYETYISILPRTPDPIYIPPKLKKQKRVWTFPISIWAKDFKFETEDFLKKCFEKDWSCSKINKVVKNPEELNQVKDVLWKNYRQIKETYKNYASYNPSGDIWSISGNPITEFCQTCDLIDKVLKLSDIDFNHIATCSASIEYKGNPRNPDRALCRFQFMEFLVRIAIDKYYKTKVAQSFVEAVEMLIKQCANVMAQYDAQKWRDERYFNEFCDDLCKYFKTMILNVYQKFSTKKVKPGQKNFMCLDELHDICTMCGFYDENFVERDANLAFNLSMFTQIDELDSDRIFQMTFTEFMEAIARIAEKLSPIPVDADQVQIDFNNFQSLEWNYERRFSQPLWLKLEKTFTLLAQNCANDDFRNTLGKPKKSFFSKIEEQD